MPDSEIVVAQQAADDLGRLIISHSLPADTPDRVRSSLRPLARFPLLGVALQGRWSGYRFVLGPWRWMVIVYRVEEESGRIVAVTVQDGRSESTPLARRRISTRRDR
jgi:plasmid stabilization system protein ParE